jgi:CheY-like chemotaxis protein
METGPENTTMQLENLHILYVEDDMSSREIFSVLLQKILGVKRVVVFDDSTNFDQVIETYPTPPDLVFLDIHVRPYNGYDMLDIIRQKTGWELVKVIALTASVMANEVNELQAAGFDSLISKPINPDTFVDYLCQILAGERVWVVSWD